jgi:hypothetical protein
VEKLSGAYGMDVNWRNTAVLQEIGGGYYAIDPSLVDFAVPPPVIPLEAWLGSWPPDLSAVSETAPPGAPERPPVRS